MLYDNEFLGNFLCGLLQPFLVPFSLSLVRSFSAFISSFQQSKGISNAIKSKWDKTLAIGQPAICRFPRLQSRIARLLLLFYMPRYLIITSFAVRSAFVHSYCQLIAEHSVCDASAFALILLTTAIIITLTLNLYVLNDSTLCVSLSRCVFMCVSSPFSFIGLAFSCEAPVECWALTLFVDAFGACVSVCTLVISWCRCFFSCFGFFWLLCKMAWMFICEV